MGKYMEEKDEFHTQTIGTLLALRAVTSAILKTHPEPEKLLNAIKEILKSPNALDGQFPPPLQAQFDERVQEMLSHLYLRLEKPNN
jgi:hypothetical protein